MPVSLLIFSTISRFSSSSFLMDSAQGPSPQALKRLIYASSRGMYFFSFFSSAIQIFFKQSMIFKLLNHEDVRKKEGRERAGIQAGVNIGLRMGDCIGNEIDYTYYYQMGSMCSEKENSQPRKDLQPTQGQKERSQREEKERKRQLKSREKEKSQPIKQQTDPQLILQTLIAKEKEKYEEQMRLLQSQNRKKQEEADELARKVREYQQRLKDYEEDQKINQIKSKQRQEREYALRQQYEKKIIDINTQKARKISQYEAQLSARQQLYQQMQQKTLKSEQQGKMMASKLKEEHQELLSKLEQEHQNHLRSLEKEVQERKYSSYNKQKRIQEMRYNELFQNDIFIDFEHYKQELATIIEETYHNKIIKTRMLYKFDSTNKVNFHRFIDNIPHIVVIIRLDNDYFMVGYSQGAFAPKTASTKDALLISLNNNKTFRLAQANRRAITYDDYYLIIGNSQLRLRSQQSKIFSNFALSTGYFSPLGESVNTLLGHGTQREVDLLGYQIYQIIFQRQ